jgi:ribosomal protein S21
VPGALALGGFAALMEFIPNFGPTIAAIPAVAAGFTVKPVTALYVAAFYFLLQQVQNAITVPLVEKRAGQHPPRRAPGVAADADDRLRHAWRSSWPTPLLAVLVVSVRILYLEPKEERQQWDRREGLTRRRARGGGPSRRGEAGVLTLARRACILRAATTHRRGRVFENAFRDSVAGRSGPFVFNPLNSSWRACVVEIQLGENDRLDWALKQFRRRMIRSGLFKDMRRKRFYEKPSEARKAKSKAAQRRRAKDRRNARRGRD